MTSKKRLWGQVWRHNNNHATGIVVHGELHWSVEKKSLNSTCFEIPPQFNRQNKGKNLKFLHLNRQNNYRTSSVRLIVFVEILVFVFSRPQIDGNKNSKIYNGTVEVQKNISDVGLKI